MGVEARARITVDGAEQCQRMAVLDDRGGGGVGRGCGANRDRDVTDVEPVDGVRTYTEAQPHVPGDVKGGHADRPWGQVSDRGGVRLQVLAYLRRQDGWQRADAGCVAGTRLNSSHLVISYAVFCL